MGDLERKGRGEKLSLPRMPCKRNANFLYIHICWLAGSPLSIFALSLSLSFHFNIHQLTAFVFVISSLELVSDASAWNS